MSKKFAVIMDPIESINYAKDTTLALLWAAQEQGWELLYAQLDDLLIKNGKAFAHFKALSVKKDAQDWFSLGQTQTLSAEHSQVILMRKDPPFDNAFLHATYWLDQAQRQGALVVNNPASIRDKNEKLFATEFPDCCPPHIVSKHIETLKDFHREQGDVIFKPLDGMGGTGIFRCKPNEANINVILETLTQLESEFIMGQRYIPEIKQGDKRVLMIDGVPVPYALARIPAKGETRGNLAAGGSGLAQPLSDNDKKIAARVGPTLKEKGLLFVGLDIIGDYLTEINVTSPTCAREIDKAYDTNIGEALIRAIEKQL